MADVVINIPLLFSKGIRVQARPLVRGIRKTSCDHLANYASLSDLQQGKKMRLFSWRSFFFG